MFRATMFSIIAATCVLVTSTAARATLVPYTEEFAADSANWRDAAGLTPLSWNASGGPDSSSYASTSFNFVSSAPNATPPIMRAQDEFNSSGNAFVGNWIADGVNQLSVDVRHNASTPLTFFTRIASPVNFPGVAAVDFVPVLPNTWTTLIFPIVPGNPQFVFEGPPSTFNSVFSNVGHLQVGVMVPAALAGLDQSFTFDVDKASIVPEPASIFAIACSAFLLIPRRRIAR
jgi:hypothetical protein